MAISRVRQHGIAVDEGIAQLQTKAAIAAWTPAKENLLQNYCRVGGFVANVSYGLIGLGDEKYQPNELTDAVAHCLASEQEPDGSWNITDIRPPLGISRIKWTALCMRALQLYAPAGSTSAYRLKIERAKKFLLAAKATRTQDLAFQILGLQWAGAGEAVIRPIAKRLSSEQRPDGGWAQIATMQPDAYATGQAMFALHEGAGWNPTDAVYQRGVEYLRRTQLADGSWHVRSRAFGFQPYFETGFPHGRDQFISSAATGWAVIALAPVIEELPKMAKAK
jgi:squalene cyclase